MELINEQWEKLKGLIPDPVKRADGHGRPARNKRQLLEGVLRILRTGAPGKICQPVSRPSKPVTAGSGSGKRKA